MRIALLLLLVSACGGKKDEPAPKEEPHYVAFAREELPDLDKRLASNDPESASSVCAVLKPDLMKIRTAAPDLATEIETKCGHDLALRAFTVATEKVEAARKAQPTGTLFECAGRNSYETMLATSHVASEPALPDLRRRWDAACPKP